MCTLVTTAVRLVPSEAVCCTRAPCASTDVVVVSIASAPFAGDAAAAAAAFFSTGDASVGVAAFSGDAFSFSFFSGDAAAAAIEKASAGAAAVSSLSRPAGVVGGGFQLGGRSRLSPSSRTSGRLSAAPSRHT